MQVLSAAFATMVASNDLLVANEVIVTVAEVPQYADVTMACESVEVDRSMTTDAPAVTRLITGYPSAQATIVLSGLIDPMDETVSAPWLYDPYNPASPIYRGLILDAPVKYRAGLWVGDAFPELATMFTGAVDSYVVDPVAGTVELTCLDGRTRLRSVPEFLTTICDPMPVPKASDSSVDTIMTSPGLTNTYMVNAILRQNGIYASPPERAGALMYSAMAGGGFPQTYNSASFPAYCDTNISDFGEPNTASLQRLNLMAMEPGYWAQQVPRDFELFGGVFPNSGDPADGIVWKAGGGFYFETMMLARQAWKQPWIGFDGIAAQGLLTVNVYEDSGTLGPPQYNCGFNLAGPAYEIAGILDPDDAWTFISLNGGHVPFSMQPGWHQISAQITFPTITTTKYVIYVDGVQVVSYTETSPTLTPVLNNTATSARIQSTLPCECVTLTPETAGVPYDYLSFVPEAYLDASLNHIFATIDETASDAWTVIQALAESEYALAGFDELGIFQYLNRVTLRTGLSKRTVTANTSLKAITSAAQNASANNRIIVPINAVTIGDYQPIWTGFNTDPTTIGYAPAHSVLYGGTFQAAQPFTGLSTFIYLGLFPPAVEISPGVFALVGHSQGQDGSGFRACRTADGTGAAVTSGISWLAYQTDPDTFVLTLQNNNAFPVYFVTPTGHGYAASDVGKPLMLIGASPITFGQTDAGASGETTTSTVDTSTTVQGLTQPAAPGLTIPPANAQWVVDGAIEDALTNPANEWIQDAVCAQILAEDLLEDLVYPRPVLGGVGIVADPRLQLADRLTLQDPEIDGMNDDAITFGITTTVSATAWDQSLDLRAANQPGYWVLGQPGHSELDLTTWM